MKKTEALVRQLLPGIRDKAVLEVACGSADFSLAVATFAGSVSCIDLDASRMNPQILETKVRFQVMDATQMAYPDNSFDTVVLYNAFSHIQSQWREIKRECRRVVRDDGAIYVVGTWKMNVSRMEQVFGKSAVWLGDFLLVKLGKDTAATDTQLQPLE